MNDNKLIEEMRKYSSKLNLSKVDNLEGQITIEEVVQFQNDGLFGKTTEEIEKFLFKVHAYNTSLKNKRASLRAFIRGLDALLDRFVSENIENVDKYLPYDSKKEIICSRDEEVRAILDKNNQCKMHLDRIGDLPEGIDSTLRSIENYLRRRFSI